MTSTKQSTTTQAAGKIGSNVVDLLATFGDKYRIIRDPASTLRNSDPWYWVIPCRFGEIYPFGGDLLCVWIVGSRRSALAERLVPQLRRHQIGEGETIFLFPLTLFDRVAELVRPRRKRRLSAGHRKTLTAAGAAHRFSANQAGLNEPSTPQIPSKSGKVSR
jgi:hypothetical protein